MNAIRGIAASPGIAIGTAVIVADLVTGVPTAMAIADFAADRPPRPPTCDSVPAMLARAHAER